MNVAMVAGPQDTFSDQAYIATLAPATRPGPCGHTMDAVSARLNAVQHVQFKQGRALLEGLTGGVMPNKYIMSDMTLAYQPMREGQPYGEMEGWPMFIAEEKSGECCSRDCWCRLCCNPNHPSITELYASSGPLPGIPCTCCGCKCWDTADYSVPVGQPIMTFERLGCCQRFANCWVCCESCQDEMRFHSGGGFSADQAGDLPTDRVVGVGKVPIGGGGCTPTIDIFTAPGEAGGTACLTNVENVGKEGDTSAKSFVVEGPTCFGGLYDWCCDTTFFVSKEAGKSGDLAHIIKKKPHDCSTCCRAMCTTADIYDLHMKEGSTVTPAQKAMIIGEMVHLDYMFFERDTFPITCEKQGDTTWITCLLCLCYCYGCLCPIKCCIALKEKGGGGD